MELGGSQSVPLCQSQNYFVNLHLEIVSPNGDYQKHVICQVSKNKIWPRSVIHGQLGLIFILIFAKLSKLSESKLAFWIKNILGMIFLKKLETGQVTVGDVGVGAQWCLVVLVTSIRLPLPTDVTQWYISSSPRHSPPLLILLCWTIRLPFIFNQWRQFWVKSRAINIKNFAIVLPFRIPRSSKVCSKCTKWPFRQSCDEVSRTLIILEVLKIERWMSRQLLLKKICHKASPLGSASDFYILNIQSPFGHFIAHKPSSKTENLTFRCVR